MIHQQKQQMCPAFLLYTSVEKCSANQSRYQYLGVVVAMVSLRVGVRIISVFIIPELAPVRIVFKF